MVRNISWNSGALFCHVKEIPGFVEDSYDRDAVFRELVEKTL